LGKAKTGERGKNENSKMIDLARNTQKEGLGSPEKGGKLRREGGGEILEKISGKKLEG